MPNLSRSGTARTIGSIRHGRWTLAFCTALALAAPLVLGGCSGPGGLNHIVKPNSTPENEGIKPVEVVNTPKSRMLQVAWTSVRAQKCGFQLDQPKLKANFLASEGTQGGAPTDLQKLSSDYDAAQAIAAKRLAKNDDYCKPNVVEEIRSDVTRYLAGDFAPRAIKPANPSQAGEQSSASDGIRVY